ncbi:PTS glucose transporter subunit IIA [Lactobacillus sp. YT155]|uniref:PTS sugar transporter subunit IIA n=1 Tax=Lactobacillus sp. YT155 TaxID=3060955 RepID=UPI00265DD922|nr:PTS glucose transporter subunit IIA [Lactobacillus sp. YT155]MDO1605658.1 PTS glucose transporter subunit IIA [Lactobacillus sp. YT155]
MFNIFKKKNDVNLFSPVNGSLVELKDINDPVFSQKMMGDGFGVKPNSNEIYAPIKGKIINIFKTKHAISIIDENGLEILVHVGLDTVELNGEPFEILVKEGQAVDENTQLMIANFNLIKQSNKDTTVITVITNSTDKVEKIDFFEKLDVTHSDKVGSVQVKE